MSHNAAPVNIEGYRLHGVSTVNDQHACRCKADKKIDAAINAAKIMGVIDAFLVDRSSVDEARWRDTESAIFQLLS